jgi:choline dehydrogenase
LPGVGASLHDHPVIGMLYECRQPVSLGNAETLLNYLRYKLFRSGPLTSNLAEAGAFVKTRPDAPSPDLQLHFVPALAENHAISQMRPHGFSMAPVLIRPRSRGRLTLRSSGPLAHPAIDPQYLADADDVQALVAGVRLCRHIAAQPALAAYRGAELLPGETVEDERSVSQFVRSRLETLYHPVGTCKMGRDENAVVDAKLRVHGVEGLRVADASIMPVIPGGNTNAPTIMIAEKAAQMIRDGS